MARSLGWLLIGVACLGTPARGQDRQPPLSLEALLSAPSLAVGDPAVAPDGSTVAYAVVDNVRKPSVEERSVFRTGVPWFALGNDIFISPIGGGPTRNLTEGQGNNWAPSWSPDGRRLAFLSDRGGGRAVNQAHLWVYEVTAGKLRKVSDLAVMDPWNKLGSLEWLSDSRTVLAKAYPQESPPPRYDSLLRGTLRQTRHPADDSLTVQVLSFDPGSKHPPRTDVANLDVLLGELVLIDVETGRFRRVSGTARIGGYVLSPDRMRVAWSEVTGYDQPGSGTILADLVVCDIRDGERRRLVRNAMLWSGFPVFQTLSWAPTSQAIAYRTDGIGRPDDIYVVSLAGGPPRRVASGSRHERFLWGEPVLWAADGRSLLWSRSGKVWRAAVDRHGASVVAGAADQEFWLIPRRPGEAWSPDGRHAIAFARHIVTKTTGLARLDLLSGTVSWLHEEASAYGFPARHPVVVPDGQGVVYAAESSQSPPNLWLARVDGHHPPKRLTAVSDTLLAPGSSPARVIEWMSLDGDTLRGALILPSSYRAGTSYPLIVKVYGGDDLSDDLNRFGFASSPIESLRVFSSRGYAVLLADSRVRYGTPMRDLFKSIMPGVERAIDTGIADPARIGIMGHSYGGYSTLALIVQSRRFRAAVMRAGLGDLMSAYGQVGQDGTTYLLPWAEHGQGRMGGTPWEVRSRYIENSPVYYLDQVQTPLLITQGMDDRHPVQADQVFNGLRRLGKRVEYARYWGEGHDEDLWNRANQLDYLRRMVSWFDTYLKGGGS